MRKLLTFILCGMTLTAAAECVIRNESRVLTRAADMPVAVERNMPPDSDLYESLLRQLIQMSPGCQDVAVTMAVTADVKRDFIR